MTGTRNLSRWSCFNLAAVFWWPLCPAGYTKQGRQPNCYLRVTPKDIFKRVNSFLEVAKETWNVNRCFL